MQYGLIAVLNNQQIEQEQVAKAQADQPADPNAHLIGRLNAYLETCWSAALTAKQPIEQIMLEDLRQREGIYDPDKLIAIREQGGSELFMQLSNLKCRALDSWLRDVMLQPGERPFYCGPSHDPELNPDVQETIVSMVVQEALEAAQNGVAVTPREVYERARARAEMAKQRIGAEADIRAKRMEEKIDDMFLQGAWYDALEDFIGDLVGLPYAVLKGPVIRKKRRLVWRQGQSGKWEPQASDELTPIWYSPSPLDIYPAPDSSGPQDGYIFEKIPSRHASVYKMIGVPGYKEEAIRAVLEEYPNGYRIGEIHEQQRKELEGKRNWEASPDAGLDILEFHGSVSGELLLEWGIDAARIKDPQAYYEVTCAKIGRHVIRCVLNEHPLGWRPYEVSSFDKIKGQFGGRSLPRTIRDPQEVCNATARALVNNLAIASGPLGEVEIDRLAEGEDATRIWPWRMVQTQSNKSGTPGPAVRWHNVNSHANELVAVYTYFSQLADTYSGVQSFDHGVASRSGSAATAQGLSMLMNASSRQMKRVIGGIDNVVCGSVKRAHVHIMLHDPDDEVKHDVEIEARGASQLLVREQQQMRRAEFLALTNNPTDMAILGPEGRSELLRETVKNLDIPVDLVVPDRDTIIARVKQAAMQAAEQQLAMSEPGGSPQRPMLPGPNVPRASREIPA